MLTTMIKAVYVVSVLRVLLWGIVSNSCRFLHAPAIGSTMSMLCATRHTACWSPVYRCSSKFLGRSQPRTTTTKYSCWGSFHWFIEISSTIIRRIPSSRRLSPVKLTRRVSPIAVWSTSCTTRNVVTCLRRHMYVPTSSLAASGETNTLRWDRFVIPCSDKQTSYYLCKLQRWKPPLLVPMYFGEPDIFPGHIPPGHFPLDVFPLLTPEGPLPRSVSWHMSHRESYSRCQPYVNLLES